MTLVFNSTRNVPSAFITDMIIRQHQLLHRGVQIKSQGDRLYTYRLQITLLQIQLLQGPGILEQISKLLHNRGSQVVVWKINLQDYIQVEIFDKIRSPSPRKSVSFHIKDLDLTVLTAKSGA
jgi:hypothetical protein